jgi:hypothetical protein
MLTLIKRKKKKAFDTFLNQSWDSYMCYFGGYQLIYLKKANRKYKNETKRQEKKLEQLRFKL